MFEPLSRIWRRPLRGSTVRFNALASDTDVVNSNLAMEIEMKLSVQQGGSVEGELSVIPK